MLNRFIIIISLLSISCNIDLSNCIDVDLSIDIDFKFTSTTDIVNVQDDIRDKILNNENFDIHQSIKDMGGHVLIDYGFNGFNNINENNIAVRHHLLLSVLYFMVDNNSKYHQEYNEAIRLIKYNMRNDMWNEGPGYYLYTEEILSVYDKIIGLNPTLLDFKNKNRKWISNYITPDNLLPPIGDTRRVKCSFANYVKEDKIIYDVDQTLYKKGKLYVFMRHPVNIDKYNGHSHYDIGNMVVYYGKKCIVLPVGYPGYNEKIWSTKLENSIYIDTLFEPFWRIWTYKLLKVERTDSSIKINYRIIGTENYNVSRTIKIRDNSLNVTDIGSDGINLNLSDNGYKIKVDHGGDIKEYKGKHFVGSTKKEHRRIIVPSKDNKVSVTIFFESS